MLQILLDLLSPDGDNIKEGLRETTHNTSPHMRSKTLVDEAQVEPPGPTQKQQQDHPTSADSHLENQEVATRCIVT